MEKISSLARERSDDQPDQNFGRELAKPYVLLMVGAGIGALVLLAVLLDWLPLSPATGPGGVLHYPVLVAMSLCVGASVFGAIRARSLRRSEPCGRALEVGAPILAFALAAAAGFFFGQPRSDFDLTVFVQGESGEVDRPLKSAGEVWLLLGDERRQAPIDANGQVVFTQLPLSFRLGEAMIGVEAPGFETLSPTTPIRLAGKPLTIVVRRSAKSMIGEVTNDIGVPVAGASVTVKDGPVKQTDVVGRFEMTIPGDTAAQDIDMVVMAEGYLVYRKRFPLGNDPVVIVLQRLP